MLLVGQHRYALDAYSWEIPEGGVPDGETALDGARRELLEETGVEAADWQELARVHLSNSVSDELAVLFLATGPDAREPPPRTAPRTSSVAGCASTRSLAMTLDGRITDAMTVVAIERLALLRAPGEGGRAVVNETRQDTRRDWDAIVVGLGAIGSAAAYWLSRSLGAGVLGLERFEMDHANGASADHSRIIRLSYHRPDYVRLAKRAYETWAEVEAEAGERIVTITGGLDLWPADPGDPEGRLHRQPHRRGRPVRAARRRRGPAGAGRNGASTMTSPPCGRRRAGSPTRSRATPRTAGSRAPMARPSATGHR